MPQTKPTSEQVTFLQAGTGATQRTALAKLRDTVSVKDFGAVGDGTTNDTAAMQAAHNTGKVVFYPAGRYRFSTITMSTGGIVGVGKATILDTIDTTTSDIITYTGGDSTGLLVNELGAVFKDFYLRANIYSQKSGGAGIKLNPGTSTENYTSTFDGLTIRNIPIGIYTTNSSFITIQRCYFAFFTQYGVYEDNDVAAFADNGDNTINGNWFFVTTANQPNAIGIMYRGGGGRILNNKITNGYAGIVVSPLRSTSIVLIEGNSIENHTYCNVLVETPGGAPSTAFTQISIVGNQLNSNQPGSVAAVYVAPTAYQIETVNVSNNICQVFGTVSNGIDIRNVNKFLISGNVLTGGVGASSTGYRGVFVASSASNGRIVGNRIRGFTQEAILNQSTSTIQDPYIQSGTVLVTTNAAHGTLYRGFVDVTFTNAYTAAPEILTNMSSVVGNGGVSSFASNITASGFRMNLINIANAANVDCRWVAFGNEKFS